MWGGLDFSAVAQLGNQLTDAIQRAKSELDKLDGSLAYEGSTEQRKSQPSPEDDFAVDAGGLFSAVYR